jgi:hypothetical protein
VKGRRGRLLPKYCHVNRHSATLVFTVPQVNPTGFGHFASVIIYPNGKVDLAAGTIRKWPAVGSQRHRFRIG